jgi:hypothetical protein
MFKWLKSKLSARRLRRQANTLTWFAPASAGQPKLVVGAPVRNNGPRLRSRQDVWRERQQRLDDMALFM